MKLTTQVGEGEGVSAALGGHATVWVEGTGPGCVGGVIFTPYTHKLRAALSTGIGPRVLLAIVGTFTRRKRFGVVSPRVPASQTGTATKVAAGASDVSGRFPSGLATDWTSGAGTSLPVEPFTCPTLLPLCLTYDKSHRK
ncbi:hypothetical protein GCM10010308_64590 [Streptomyces vinaceusdrappus]|nr:hypothetical protein GCM10010308_64590 [Streptomyces vinaceusdrappus]